MKKNDYVWNSLLAKSRLFYEAPVPVHHGADKPRYDLMAFQYKVKKLGNDGVFYLAYVEECSGNYRQFDLFSREIKSRGFSYTQYTDFLKARGIPTSAERRAV